MAKDTSREKIGLALGGGAVLGAAHIGVLKALEEHGVRPHSIAGTSIGAFIAALYAFGLSPDDIESRVADLNWLDVSGLALSRYGLISNRKLGETVRRAVGDVTFAEARLPLAVVATDIGACQKVVLDSGSVAEAVMASACVPGIVVPTDIDGRMLVDGGLVENVPISPLRAMGATLVVGVDLNAKRRYHKPEGIIDVLTNALDLAIDNATRLQTDKADWLITPELSAYPRTDTGRTRDLVREGYEEACRTLKKHPLS